MTSLAKRVAYSTIKVYLCGVQYENLVCGFNNKISQMPRLYYVLRGIRRTQGSSWLKKKRLPITPGHLKTMLQFIRESLFCEHDKKMWSCLILVAFFGLLRVSEYTTNGNHSFDSSIHLCFNDVKFDPKEEQVCIDIKASKTDPFRVGSTIRLAKIEGDICPL